MQEVQSSAQDARKKKAFKVTVDNKLRGAYAETDFDKKTIKVNRKRHFQKGYKRINPTKDGHENLTSTIYHETLHVRHPNIKEKTIRKMEKLGMKKMTGKAKKKLLAHIY